MSRPSQAYQFKVTLLEIEPAIWRRIVVPVRYSFWDLHVAIQDSMGWLDYHLHLFRVREPESGEVDEIGIPDAEPYEGEPQCLPGWEVSIVDYFAEPGDTAEYLYDFGDDWKHLVMFEGLVNRVPKTRYPKCLAGSRACPPEDCGGVGGYEDVLRVIADPSSGSFSPGPKAATRFVSLTTVVSTATPWWPPMAAFSGSAIRTTASCPTSTP